MRALLVVLLVSGPALAESPQPWQENQCDVEGQGATCTGDDTCAELSFASFECMQSKTADATKSCQIPCYTVESGTVTPQPSACSAGETCVEASSAAHGTSDSAWFCKPGRFRVDLNLLDQCVLYHLRPDSPGFAADQCSIAANLNRMLDQNNDGEFDIFDLDLCVLAFMERPLACAPAGQTQPNDPKNVTQCDDDLVWCTADDDCGRGLHCDVATNACVRECGLIASRSSDIASAVNRPCTGQLQTCDPERGKCVQLTAEQVDTLTCEIDADCVSGAYCFLGRCAPRCYAATDCPDVNWFCAADNKCRALPPPQAENGFIFEPQNYVIRFVRDQLDVNAIETTDESSLAIMDLVTKRQVVGNAAIAFGYRVLGTEYGTKMDTQCQKPIVDCEEASLEGETVDECNARQEDCLIRTDEQWLVTQNPFGTISAASQTGFVVQLDPVRVEALSPGVYPATVQLAFDNGDTDTIRVVLTKASPSGSYLGTLTIGGVPSDSDADVSLTGQRPIRFDMRMFVTGEVKQWNALMAENHITNSTGQDQSAGSYKDLNEGQVVTALLDADTALPFAWAGGSGVDAASANEVPFKGIYKPDTGFMRLVGVIEVGSDFCVDEDGDTCAASVPATCDANAPLEIRNPFGRRIRRQIEFFGTFDDAAGRFAGTYIETIRGLLPNTPVTLEGDFSLQQLVSDATPLNVPDSLVPTAQQAYPEDELEAYADADGGLDAAKLAGVAEACGAYTAESAKFGDLSAFTQYLLQAKRSTQLAGADADNVLGKTVVFPDVVHFSKYVESALTALADAGGVSEQDQKDYLSIYDFLSDWIEPCSSADDSPSPFCLNEDAARCGLALHRQALLESGWLSLKNLEEGAVDGAGELPMFCADDIPLDGCPGTAAGNEGLFMLQEHNRFWSLLAQSWKFDGDRARSDAFLTLFRNEVNPFVAGTARAYKAEQLRLAVCRYDQAVDLMASPAASTVLEAWPAEAFSGRGRDWLTIMYAVSRDRMDIVSDLVDLRRRVFLATDAADFRFAQHLMQHEYLLQVYLMAIQARWQGDAFTYTGSAAQALEVGQQMIQQLNPARTVVGTVKNRVFFENSDPTISNWEAYRERIVGVDGKLEKAQAQVADAVTNLQGSLKDLDTFEQKLLDSQQYLEEQLDEMCGSRDLLRYQPVKGSSAAAQQANKWCDTKCSAGELCFDGECRPAKTVYDDLGATNFCQVVLMEHWEDTEAWQHAFNGGKGPDMPGDAAAINSGVECPDFGGGKISDNKPCQTVVNNFKLADAAINQPNPQDGFSGQYWTPPTCNLQFTTIEINGQMRPCAGGEVGRLLQEKMVIDLNRKHLLGDLNTIVSMLGEFAKWHGIVGTNNTIALGIDTGLDLAKFARDLVFGIDDVTTSVVSSVGDAVDCEIVAGLAVGTDCPGSAIGGAMKSVVFGISGGVRLAVNSVFQAADLLATEAKTLLDMQKGATERQKDFWAIAHEMDGVIDTYQLWTQESFNLSLQIADARQRAQSAADRYREGVAFAAERLVGRESGFVLLGNHLVGEASKTFRDIVEITYRMTMAYNHRYNLAPDVAQTLLNQAVSVTTLDEVADFVALLDSAVSDYCGVEAIDCDSSNNSELLRYSLREQMFPNLRPKVDASSGEVIVSVGEQFHNLITGATHVRRRARGPLLVDQIEVPFTIPLTVLQNAPGGPEWLLNPLDCNHQLVAPVFAADGVQNIGTLAVQVIGKNLNKAKGLKYQLQRGGTDFMRSCHIKAVQEEIGTLPVEQYPIRQLMIGYAPNNPLNELSTIPSFVTRSENFDACLNDLEEDVGDSGCWRYFARDRSLAALDWKLIVPLAVDGAKTHSAWVAGDGLSDDEKPIIEDVIIYFRYRTRPVQEL